MITARNLNINDMPDIEHLISEHSTMYGIEFNPADIFIRYNHCILKHHAVGVFNGTVLIAACTQFYWDKMPVWTLSNLFMKTSKNSYMSKEVIKALGALTEQCIRNAENKEIFEFYYLFRDSDKFIRKTQTRDIISESNKYVSSRYDFINMHMIKSPDDIKFEYLKNFLGDIGLKAIAEPYNKTLILRRATIKTDFRII